MYTEKQRPTAAAGPSRKATQQKPAFHIDDNRPQTTAQARLIRTLQRSADDDELLQGKTIQREADEEELIQGKFTAQRQEDEDVLQGKTIQREADEEELIQGKFSAQRQENEDVLQGKTIQREADEEELIQGKFIAQRQGDEDVLQGKTIQREADEEELIQGKFTAQRQAEPNRTGMPDEVKQRMESSFGTDFSGVRMHPDSSAAPQVGALAYTQGNDIHFAPGQFKPDTPAGRQLIGHELAHVVQQQAGRVSATTEISGMPVNDNPALENEADRMGEKAAGH